MATEPTTGQLIGPIHHYPVRVYYEDTDFSGIVYHANYLKFFERGRTEMLRSLGVHQADMKAGIGVAFAVLEMTIRFKLAARMDDVLQIQTQFIEIKGARFFMAQKLCRGTELIAETELSVACLAPDGRPTRPPGPLLAAIKHLQENEKSSF